MYKSQIAKDIMVSKLVTLSPDMDAFEAIGILLRHRISGAPVIDSERNFLGVFSEKSSMQLLIDAAYEQVPSCQVAEFMNTDRGRTITEHTGLLSIVQIFLGTPYRRLPVLRGDKLVGQISRRDVLRAAMEITKVAPHREKPLLYLSALIERDDAPLE